MHDPSIRSSRAYRRNAAPEPPKRAVLVAPFLRVPDPLPGQVFHLFYVKGGLLDHRGQLQEWIVSSSIPPDPEERRWYPSTLLFAARPDGTKKLDSTQIESPVERTANVREVFEALGVIFQDRLVAQPDAPPRAPATPTKRGWNFWGR